MIEEKILQNSFQNNTFGKNVFAFICLAEIVLYHCQLASFFYRKYLFVQ